MAREEAIKILKKLLEGCYYPKRTEALNMAIQVLEQEPCEYLCEVPSYEMTLEQARQEVKALRKWLVEHLEQEPCEDAISRQAVIDLIIANHVELNGVNVVMYSPLYKDIEQLSPVTPQPKRAVMIAEKIGLPAMYEMLAEECVELAHEALKMARIIRGENPTPKTREEVKNSLVEEVTDVELCLEQLDLRADYHIWDKKIKRFNQRWKESGK